MKNENRIKAISLVLIIAILLTFFAMPLGLSYSDNFGGTRYSPESENSGGFSALSPPVCREMRFVRDYLNEATLKDDEIYVGSGNALVFAEIVIYVLLSLMVRRKYITGFRKYRLLI